MPATVNEQRNWDALFGAVYEELRRLAASVGRKGSQTLNPTALVNEAWVKLAKSPNFQFTSALHFKRIAAAAMRQVVIEAIRRRDSLKRGGDGAVLVTYDEDLQVLAGGNEEVLAFDEALAELTTRDERQAKVVELRFFGELSVAETAEILNVAEITVERDWRAAKAWLKTRLRKG